MTFFDAFYVPHIAHRTPDEITRCLRESTAAMRTEQPHTQPDTRTEPYVDGETRLSPRSLRSITKPSPLRINPDGWDNRGHWHGAPGVDFDVERMLP